MTTSGWRPGDLGRSKIATDIRPQFEALSADKAGVILWHHMRETPDVVPVATFRRDYTPDWKLATAVPEHQVQRGHVYSMDRDLPCAQETVVFRRQSGDLNIMPMNPRAWRGERDAALTHVGAPNPALITIRGSQGNDQAEWERKTALYIRSKQLKVRRVQHNFASCEVLGDVKSLVIIPVEWIDRWGHIYNLLWDHLESDWSL